MSDGIKSDGITSDQAPRPSGSSQEGFGGIRVRIVGDGTPKGTKVINVATGQPIANVKRIEYAVSVDEAPIRARITVGVVEVDMQCQADLIEVPV